MRPADHDYWAYYSIGLLNGYTESRVIPPAVHSWLLEQSDLNTGARGYRAGYRLIESFVVDPDHADAESVCLDARRYRLQTAPTDTQ